MSDTVTVTLGGKDYAVRKLNLGQLRRILSADVKPSEFGFKLLEIALERVEPKLEGKVDDIELDVAEFRAAVDAIGEFARLRLPGKKTEGEASAEGPTA